MRKMQYVCNERGYDMGMRWFGVEITNSKPIWRENERARVLGFESVTKKVQKMDGF